MRSWPSIARRAPLLPSQQTMETSMETLKWLDFATSLRYSTHALKCFFYFMNTPLVSFQENRRPNCNEPAVSTEYLRWTFLLSPWVRCNCHKDAALVFLRLISLSAIRFGLVGSWMNGARHHLRQRVQLYSLEPGIGLSVK